MSKLLTDIQLASLVVGAKVLIKNHNDKNDKVINTTCKQLGVITGQSVNFTSMKFVIANIKRGENNSTVFSTKRSWDYHVANPNINLADLKEMVKKERL